MDLASCLPCQRTPRVFIISVYFHQSVAMLVGLQSFESEVVLISQSSVNREAGWVHELVIPADDLQQQWMDHFIEKVCHVGIAIEEDFSWVLHSYTLKCTCWPTCICTGVYMETLYFLILKLTTNICMITFSDQLLWKSLHQLQGFVYFRGVGNVGHMLPVTFFLSSL